VTSITTRRPSPPSTRTVVPHADLERHVERDAPADRNLEVWNGRFATGLDLSERAAERPGGVENAGDAVELAQVGLGEPILAGDRRVGDPILVPRTELPSGRHLADRLWVGHGRVEADRPVEGDRVEGEPMDVEHPGSLGRVGGPDLQPDLRGHELVDDNRGARCVRHLLPLRRHRLRWLVIGVRGATRDVHPQLVQPDRRDAPRRRHQVAEPGVKRERAQLDERRRRGAVSANHDSLALEV
jgi:hypothetical protein